MELLGAIFGWIGTNEAVLSGIAATIVIAGVAYRPIRRLFPGRKSPTAAPEPAADVAGLAPVTDRPSIAVIPFANLSSDAEQEFLADGLTEDIIFGLSRIKQLFVIARNSSFTYKGRHVDAAEVSRDLGVRYVLEGSVRRTGDRIRVTAQLVDASTRSAVWSEHYDRDVEAILQVDDEVTRAILAALQPALRRAEAEHAGRSAPEDLTAWALVNRAWVAVQSDLSNLETARRTIGACEDALRRDPDYAFAHAVLAHATSLIANDQHDDDLAGRARSAIERALTLDPDDPQIHHCHAAMAGNLGTTAEGVRAWERAIELDPNSAGARAGLGIARIYLGEPDAALGQIEAALRLSPRDPLAYHWLGNQALALALLGRFEEAERCARDALDRRSSRIATTVLAAVLGDRGDLDEAAAAWREFAERSPGVTPQQLIQLAGALAPRDSALARIERGLVAAADAAGNPAPA